MKQRNKSDNIASRAFALVAGAFDGMTDKAGKPYIEHLRRVGNSFVDEKQKAVGYLHDLLEDCEEWNEGLLRDFFEDDIVDAVVCLTKKDNEPYSEYMERVIKNPLAKSVKIADLKDNMDVSRLEWLTDRTVERLRKYIMAYQLLTKQ